MAVNYVKFQRGSQTAYEALKTAGKLDDNTLYFIYPEENKSVGALYMGSRIISGGDITIASATLDDLADVIVNNAQTNSFLVKDGNNWVAKNLVDVVALIKTELGDVASTAQVFQGEWQAEEDAATAINRIIGETLVNDGDIIVLKKLITDSKYEHTAFIYSKQAWIAMDSSYNASNVYFDKDLDTLATSGKNVEEVIKLLQTSTTRKLPEKVEPTAELTSAASTLYEVGTSVAVDYSIDFNPGSYTYGPATNITPESYEVKLGEETLTTNKGTFTEIVIKDDTNLVIDATITYGDGAVPMDSLNNPLENTEELNQCQIKAGSIKASGNSIKGYRNAFFGSKITPIELTSTNLRKLNKVALTKVIELDYSNEVLSDEEILALLAEAENNSVSVDNFEVSIIDGAKQVIIAVPVGKVVNQVLDTKVFNVNVASKFTKAIVSIGGADATNENIGTYAKNYNVYTYTPAVALGATKYTVVLGDE